MANILIIDDDEAICKALNETMSRMGHDVVYILNLKEGLKEVFSKRYDVVFLDVRLPDGDGLKALSKIKRASSSPEVIIITGEGDPDGAELAIKSGAWDYIEKPPTIESFPLQLIRALQNRQEKKTRKPSMALKREGIIGESAPLRRSLDHLAQAAESDITVLITGETGTGKELFASAIHKNSSRRHKNFVVVDCAALPQNLVESVLFGHKKGAFTGADKTQEGLIKQAHQGTLFLDEVGELSISIQKTFLRVLQEHRFRPVGASKEIESDFRLIAATNRDLEQMTKAGKFRQELLFRLRSIVIGLPSLKERSRDIKDLAMFYMTRFCERNGTGTKGFSPEFIESLMTYDWPGNVRELINAMNSTLTTAGADPILFPKYLPTHIRVAMARESIGKTKLKIQKSDENDGTSPALDTFKEFRTQTVAKAEKSYLQNLMSQTGWNIKEACQISALSRPRLYGLLKKHAISRSG